MLDAADALPLAVERAEPSWRRAVERSVQDHCDVSDKPEIGRDAFSPYNHRGTVVVASAWLVFYVIAAIHHGDVPSDVEIEGAALLALSR
jgi:hypothetical protein